MKSGGVGCSRLVRRGVGGRRWTARRASSARRAGHGPGQRGRCGAPNRSWCSPAGARAPRSIMVDALIETSGRPPTGDRSQDRARLRVRPPIGAGTGCLATAGPAYRLAMPISSVDSHRLRTGRSGAERARCGPSRGCLEILSSALALWRGPALPISGMVSSSPRSPPLAELHLPRSSSRCRSGSSSNATTCSSPSWRSWSDGIRSASDSGRVDDRALPQRPAGRGTRRLPATSRLAGGTSSASSRGRRDRPTPADARAQTRVGAPPARWCCPAPARPGNCRPA